MMDAQMNIASNYVNKETLEPLTKGIFSLT